MYTAEMQLMQMVSEMVSLVTTQATDKCITPLNCKYALCNDERMCNVCEEFVSRAY